MSIQHNLLGLKALAPSAQTMEEGGITYVFLPNLEVTTSQGRHLVDALICPVQHVSGYTTRVFLSKPLQGCGRSNNWTEHRILDRLWHTWSWQNVPASLSLAQILAAHLEALR